MRGKIVAYIKEGLWKGIGWSFGVTIGFMLVSLLLVLIVNILGGTPLIGGWIASLVEATQQALEKKTVIIQR